jgi:hypothetical protein
MPPAGIPPVRIKGAPSKQAAGKILLKLTAGGGRMVICVCVKSVQTPLLKVYVTV